ncbi:hypothetical protein LPY66_16940 [Dehalobacter sp. DCM]|uniref:hypothetical protein n=1 Tax=Dehalobacter sp. DCM TaxID=2907827 RepID=UPI00308203E0|nr:hypothetical protein LPY66_16940 [Dehalobacter sp. DCM]
MKTCNICATVKDTKTYVLQTGLASSEESEQWEVCDACSSAFHVMEEYVQGQQ